MIAVLERRLTFVTVVFIFDRTVCVRLSSILSTFLQEARERVKMQCFPGSSVNPMDSISYVDFSYRDRHRLETILPQES